MREDRVGFKVCGDVALPSSRKADALIDRNAIIYAQMGPHGIESEIEICIDGGTLQIRGRAMSLSVEPISSNKIDVKLNC